jgi:hemolysin activation/secretion protein
VAACVASLLAASSAWPAEGDRRAPARLLDVLEYRVEGSTRLSPAELEATVRPYLGLLRSLDDVEKARAAVEKAYQDAGFQSVTVALPPQTVREGIVTLAVTEGRVGRLRVRGARWFLPSEIRAQAPSLAEGTVPNFNEVVRDIVVLNQLPDRRVTPAVQVGTDPGTVDVDLNVEDHLPLHGSLGVDDKHGRDTTLLRTAASLHYDNLWQLGHSLSFSARLAPKRLDDGRVLSASYQARFPELTWLSLQLNGINHDSNITTVGGVGVAGKGYTVGSRAVFTLPGTEALFSSISVGADYKHARSVQDPPQAYPALPTTIVPMVVQYAGSHEVEGSSTQLVATLAWNIRMLSSSYGTFDSNRFKSSDAFLYGRADLTHRHTLPLDLRITGRVQGQATPDALLGSEQLSAGGADSVRGYLEAETVGDFGAVGTVELASPSLSPLWGRSQDEWRFHVFADAGWVGIHQPLPEQRRAFAPVGVGGGTRLKITRHVNAELEVGVPLRSEGVTRRHHPRYHFAASTEF